MLRLALFSLRSVRDTVSRALLPRILVKSMSTTIVDLADRVYGVRLRSGVCARAELNRAVPNTASSFATATDFVPINSLTHVATCIHQLGLKTFVFPFEVPAAFSCEVKVAPRLSPTRLSRALRLLFIIRSGQSELSLSWPLVRQSRDP